MLLLRYIQMRFQKAFAIVIMFSAVIGCSSPLAVAHEITSDNTVIIHMSEQGYEPDTIQITPGTTVIFENAGDSDFWPASDHHPSHTQYNNTNLEQHCKPGATPSFDACKGIEPGQTYEFTFNREGTFAFHDHLWPHLTGEIQVVQADTTVQQAQQHESEMPAEKSFFQRARGFFSKIFANIRSLFAQEDTPIVLNAPETNTEFYEQSRKYYEQLVLEQDPKVALQTLQDNSAADDKVNAVCHDMLHVIGHAAYEKYGGFKEAIAYNSDFCNSGYIHGLFESYFELEDDSLNGVGELCSEYAATRQFDQWQCHHGIGHGFMYLTGGDLPASLQLCSEKLSGADAESCQNGVYMEVFNSEVLSKEKEFVDPENPFATCTDQADARAHCYLYVPTYLYQTKQLSFEEMFAACSGVAKEYRVHCVSGIGAEAIKRNMQHPETVFELCKRAPTRGDRTACAQSVVSMYLNQTGSYEAGAEVCAAAPQEFAQLCKAEWESSKEFYE